nr:hypothetical protein [Oceanicoccus sagamiensis]
MPPKNKNKKKASPLLPALSGLGLSLFLLLFSYQYLSVNVYKMFAALFIGSGLLLIACYIHIKSRQGLDKTIIYCSVLIALPFLTLMPGYLFNQVTTNYFFKEEFGLLLITLMWSWIILLTVKSEKEIAIFLQALVIGIIGSCLIATLNIDVSEARPIGRRMSSALSSANFGNSNYFASFLILVIPIYAGAALGAYKQKPQKSLTIGIYGLVVVLGLWALLYTQSRAAIASLVIMLAILLVAFIGLSRQRPVLAWRTLLLSVAIGSVGIWLLQASPYSHVLVILVNTFTPEPYPGQPPIKLFLKNRYWVLGRVHPMNYFFSIFSPKAAHSGIKPVISTPTTNCYKHFRKVVYWALQLT